MGRNGDCVSQSFSCSQKSEESDPRSKKTDMKANELLKRIESNTAPVVLDVRTGIEFKRGHVPGAINAPARKILLKMAKLPKNTNTER